MNRLPPEQRGEMVRCAQCDAPSFGVAIADHEVGGITPALAACVACKDTLVKLLSHIFYVHVGADGKFQIVTFDDAGNDA